MRRGHTDQGLRIPAQYTATHERTNRRWRSFAVAVHCRLCSKYATLHPAGGRLHFPTAGRSRNSWQEWPQSAGAVSVHLSRRVRHVIKQSRPQSCTSSAEKSPQDLAALVPAVQCHGSRSLGPTTYHRYAQLLSILSTAQQQRTQGIIS